MSEMKQDDLVTKDTEDTKGFEFSIFNVPDGVKMVLPEELSEREVEDIEKRGGTFVTEFPDAPEGATIFVPQDLTGDHNPLSREWRRFGTHFVKAIGDLPIVHRQDHDKDGVDRDYFYLELTQTQFERLTGRFKRGYNPDEYIPR